MNLLSRDPFAPKPYADIVNSFPPGAMPEITYRQLCDKYARLGENDPKVFRIAYESDGLAVTGAVAQPAQLRTGGHPIVIYNRGGSREYGVLTVFEAIRQLIPLAQDGNLVYASNYRGNDGGEGREEFGGADVRDVLHLIDLAKQDPHWNGRHIFMVGHSRGGMMTYLAIKEGAPVTAAVAIAAISDLHAWADERPELVSTLHARLIPGGETQRHAQDRARSAVYWAERLRHVPILLLHGDKDEAVPVGHSERMAEAMGKAGAPHELHIYSGGNHALVRHWEDVKERTRLWLERYR